MKHRIDWILRSEQASYLEGLLPPRDKLMSEMEELAAKEKIPISDPEVGLLLSLLARAIGARRILEIGTAIGYGILCFRRGTPDASIVSIDNDPEQLDEARSYLSRAGVESGVRLLEGEAMEVLPTLEGPFDLVYVDAEKTEYRQYLDLLMPILRPGGMLLVDNLLWFGQVAEPPLDEAYDPDSIEALRVFNRSLVEHPGFESLIMPLGDGVGIATKICDG